MMLFRKRPGNGNIDDQRVQNLPLNPHFVHLPGLGYGESSKQSKIWMEKGDLSRIKGQTREEFGLIEGKLGEKAKGRGSG